MTYEEMQSMFEKHDDEYLSGDVEGPRDLMAFNLLNKLVPSRKDIVSAAEHDEFYLSSEPEEVAKVATEEDVVLLIRCGVRLDTDTESFSMFA